MYEKHTSVSDGIANPIHYRREVHDTTRYSTIEVITPCVSIRMEKFEQRKKLSSKRTNRGRSEEGQCSQPQGIKQGKPIGYSVPRQYFFEDKSKTWSVQVDNLQRLCASISGHHFVRNGSFGYLLATWKLTRRNNCLESCSSYKKNLKYYILDT